MCETVRLFLPENFAANMSFFQPLMYFFSTSRDMKRLAPAFIFYSNFASSLTPELHDGQVAMPAMEHARHNRVRRVLPQLLLYLVLSVARQLRSQQNLLSTLLTTLPTPSQA